jgi:hypothetical protein
MVDWKSMIFEYGSKLLSKGYKRICTALFAVQREGNHQTKAQLGSAISALVKRIDLAGTLIRGMQRLIELTARLRIVQGQMVQHGTGSEEVEEVEDSKIEVRSGSRGRIGYMQYINGFIGFVLVLFAVAHVPHPTPLAWLPYAGAALLAFITLKSEISIGLARILAISTTAMMFFFFAGFFVVAPKLAADWYMHQAGWAAVCLILSAFTMIPLLSEYSCRLKKDCRDERAARRTAFFSVPGHIPTDL